jgi:hypothetical protein
MTAVANFIRRRFRWVAGIPLALVTVGVVAQVIMGVGSKLTYCLEYLGWFVYLAMAAGLGEATSERRERRRSGGREQARQSPSKPAAQAKREHPTPTKTPAQTRREHPAPAKSAATAKSSAAAKREHPTQPKTPSQATREHPTPTKAAAQPKVTAQPRKAAQPKKRQPGPRS